MSLFSDWTRIVMLLRLLPLASSVSVASLAARDVAAQEQSTSTVELIDDPELADSPTETQAPSQGADSGVEIIQDPELADSPSETESAAEQSGSEVIDDPELAGRESGVGSAGSTASTSSMGSMGSYGASPSATSTFRAILRTRFGVDTYWENDREDVLQGTQIAILEAEHARDDVLRFAAGIRARYRFTRRRENGGLGTPERYELDVAPTAGYADVTVADGFHVRAGYQMTALGRFDFFSSVNGLRVLDLREGPTTLPEASEIAQPALRIDVDLGPSLTLQAFYVPFFQPHLIDIYGSDYALLKDFDDEFSDLAALANIPRAQISRLWNSSNRSFAPEPKASEPQGAVRLSGRFDGGELALTFVTQLDHVPALEFQKGSLDRDGRLRTFPDVEVQHPRMNVLSIDGATDIGAVQLGVELAYMENRTLYAELMNPQDVAGPTDNSERALLEFANRVVDNAPIPKPVDMVHGALKAELAEGDFIFGGEGFADYALDLPTEEDREWMLLTGGRILAGVSAAVRYTPAAGRWAFEVLALALNGPSMFVVPRIEFTAAENLWFELGAFLIDGRTDSRMSLGGAYDDTDQVFTGVRWMP